MSKNQPITKGIKCYKFWDILTANYTILSFSLAKAFVLLFTHRTVHKYNGTVQETYRTVQETERTVHKSNDIVKET